MAITFHISDISNPRAIAFLNYIKTLDFITVDNTESQDFVLTDEHQQILNERRLDRVNGKSKTHSWEEVKEFTRRRNKK